MAGSIVIGSTLRQTCERLRSYARIIDDEKKQSNTKAQLTLSEKFCSVEIDGQAEQLAKRRCRTGYGRRPKLGKNLPLAGKSYLGFVISQL